VSSLLGIVLFVLALTLAIFFHEGGHFLSAKHFGMRVERFFLGFGPTVFSFRKGETEYGLKAIPAGGFCKIAGMSPYENDQNFLENERGAEPDPYGPTPPERQFRNKPLWQRAIVLGAGSFTHFVVGLVLIYLLLVVIGRPIGDTTNQIDQVVAQGSGGVAAPAGPAGLRSGDRIIEVDGKQVKAFEDLRTALQGTAGKRITVVYLRDGERRTTSLVPATVTDSNGRQQAFLGVQPSRETVRLNPLEGIPASGALLWTVAKESVKGLGGLFTGLADRIRPPEPQPQSGGTASGGDSGDGGPVGIIGIGRLAGQAVAADQWIFFILLLIQFNVFVGIVNLLPIPPMDGGYVAFLVKEKLTGTPVDLRKVAPVAALIVGLLVTLTVGLVWLDITRPLSNPFR
jgi:membrane-associated protease RseP (regulator of RpoE activity)